jgi:2,3-bisphosphoglycerate-independent phosphoglycerate mutase
VLDAAGTGIDLKEGDTAFRANFVCLKPGATSVVMFDPLGCGVTDEEAEDLAGYLKTNLITDAGEEVDLHPMGGHRAILTYRKKGQPVATAALSGFSSPHEAMGESIEAHLPTQETARRFVHIVNDSQMILSTHPRVRERIETTMFAPNSLWLWGGGEKRSLPPLSQAAGGRQIAWIASSPGVAGLGRLGGEKPIISDQFRSIRNLGEMREAARKGMETAEFVLVFADHAAQAAERGDLREKVAAIEALDGEILAPLFADPGTSGPVRILLLADYIASTESRRPVHGPVPFAMADWADGRLSGPPRPKGLAGLWERLTSPRGRSADGPPASGFNERICDTVRPLSGPALLGRLLAA